MRFRLRHGSTDLTLRPGVFIIGRTTSSDLALDDPKVSRQHARLTIEEDAIFIDDLESKNGTVVDSEKLVGRRQLGHLSTIRIGDQWLSIFDTAETENLRPSSRRCPACDAENELEAKECASCKLPLARSRNAARTIEISLTGGPDHTIDELPSKLAIIRPLAEKAIALGKIDEADRFLRSALETLLEEARQREIPEDNFEFGVESALKLIGGARWQEWIAWLFELHASQRRVMKIDRVELLQQKASERGYSNVRPLEGYLKTLAQSGRSYTPSERFAVNRLESFLRMLQG